MLPRHVMANQETRTERRGRLLHSSLGHARPHNDAAQGLEVSLRHILENLLLQGQLTSSAVVCSRHAMIGALKQPEAGRKAEDVCSSPFPRVKLYSALCGF